LLSQNYSQGRLPLPGSLQGNAPIPSRSFGRRWPPIRGTPRSPPPPSGRSLQVHHRRQSLGGYPRPYRCGLAFTSPSSLARGITKVGPDIRIEPQGWTLCFGGMREAGGGRNDLNLRRKLSFQLPPAPFHLVRPLGLGLRVLLGIGRGLQITTDDDATSPIRPNQRREAKQRKVLGQA